jgi:hypothetical protein
MALFSFVEDRDKHQFAGRADFGDHCRAITGERLPDDEILPFGRSSILLTFFDPSCKDYAFHLIDGQAIRVHFVFSMHRHHIFAGANQPSHSVQNAVKHSTLNNNGPSLLTIPLYHTGVPPIRFLDGKNIPFHREFYTVFSSTLKTLKPDLR